MQQLKNITNNNLLQLKSAIEKSIFIFSGEYTHISEYLTDEINSLKIKLDSIENEIEKREL